MDASSGWTNDQYLDQKRGELEQASAYFQQLHSNLRNYQSGLRSLQSAGQHDAAAQVEQTLEQLGPQWEQARGALSALIGEVNGFLRSGAVDQNSPSFQIASHAANNAVAVLNQA